METKAVQMVNGAPIDYSALPEHMQDGMRIYIEHGVPDGSFLMAVLENDLRGAFSRADSINRKRIGDYVHWLYNNAPSQCSGSPAKVEAWIKRARGEA